MLTYRPKRYEHAIGGVGRANSMRLPDILDATGSTQILVSGEAAHSLSRPNPAVIRSPVCELLYLVRGVVLFQHPAVAQCHDRRPLVPNRHQHVYPNHDVRHTVGNPGLPPCGWYLVQHDVQRCDLVSVCDGISGSSGGTGTREVLSNYTNLPGVSSTKRVPRSEPSRRT